MRNRTPGLAMHCIALPEGLTACRVVVADAKFPELERDEEEGEAYERQGEAEAGGEIGVMQQSAEREIVDAGQRNDEGKETLEQGLVAVERVLAGLSAA